MEKMIDKQIARKSEVKTDRKRDRQMDGWKDEETEKQKDKQKAWNVKETQMQKHGNTEEQGTDGQMDRQIEKHSDN